MLNVLLADDETRTLHHLMTGVPWFQLGDGSLLHCLQRQRSSCLY